MSTERDVREFLEVVNIFRRPGGPEGLSVRDIIGGLNEMKLRSGRTIPTPRRQGGGALIGGRCESARRKVVAFIILSLLIGSSGYMAWVALGGSAACAYGVMDQGLGQAVCSALMTANQALSVFIKSFGQFGLDRVSVLRMLTQAWGSWELTKMVLGTTLDFICDVIWGNRQLGRAEMDQIRQELRELQRNLNAQAAPAQSAQLAAEKGKQQGGYSHIINPETGIKVNINGETGKTILKNYIKYIIKYNL